MDSAGIGKVGGASLGVAIHPGSVVDREVSSILGSQSDNYLAERVFNFGQGELSSGS
jgi:hypothetical protein